MIVVDASAWIRALVDETDAGNAAKDVLAQHPHWFAPAHVPLEVFRTLRRFEMAQLLSAEQAAEFTAGVMATAVHYYGPETWILESTWRLRHNVSIYDAPYVAIAQTLELPLVTFDRRLATAAGNSGVRVIIPGDSKSAEH